MRAQLWRVCTQLCTLYRRLWSPLRWLLPAAAAGAGALWLLQRRRHTLPPHFAVRVHWGQVPPEERPDPLAQLLQGGGGAAPPPPSLRDTVHALQQVAQDPRVHTVVVQASVPAEGGLRGIASVEELRRALLQCREAGKRTVFYTTSFGEGSSDLRLYYLASACQEVYISSAGNVGFTGITLRGFFLRDMLAKLGMEAEVYRRKEYKSALDVLHEEGFTDPVRENYTSLVNCILDHIVQGVADSRGLTFEEVAAAMEEGPLLASEAVERKLIDGIKYADELSFEEEGHAEEGAASPPKAKMISLSRYMASVRYFEKKPGRKSDAVGLLYAIGPIYGPGSSQHDGIVPERLCTQLRKMRKDKSVKAVILRVDSPGGSAMGSDIIWREIQLLRKVKPVVVSMASVAASGGYYISMGANSIFAEPSTLTGSIGVIFAKVIVEQLLQKVGIRKDEIKRGEFSDIFAVSRHTTEKEKERINLWIDTVYQTFVQKAADGRGLSFEELEAMARGRVWTGLEAVERKLIDSVGGLDDAIVKARELAGLPAECPVRESRQSSVEIILKRLTGSEDEDEVPFSGGGARTSSRGAELQALMKAAGQVLGGGFSHLETLLELQGLLLLDDSLLMECLAEQ